MKNIVKTVVAIIKGDDAEVVGLKIMRQADSALKAQIAALNGDTITLEDNLTDAEENLEKAVANYGELIKDRNVYTSNLLVAENKITMAKDALELHKAKIAVLEKHLTNLDK